MYLQLYGFIDCLKMDIVLLRPILYIALIAERQSMKIGIPGWRESRMFCK